MTPLTEKQLEAAAREYCRLKGTDPDGYACFGFTHLQLAIQQLKQRDLETIALSAGREADP